MKSFFRPLSAFPVSVYRELTGHCDSTTLLLRLIHFVRDVIDRDSALSVLFKMAIIFDSPNT